MFDPYRTSHDSKNTYSLWADSKDIDMIKIICPKVRNNDEKIQIHNPLTPLQAELRRSGWQLRPSSPVEEAPDPPDSLLRRVVDRASLYDDPENFQKSYDYENPRKGQQYYPPPLNKVRREYWYKVMEVNLRPYQLWTYRDCCKHNSGDQPYCDYCAEQLEQFIENLTTIKKMYQLPPEDSKYNPRDVHPVGLRMLADLVFVYRDKILGFDSPDAQERAMEVFRSASPVCNRPPGYYSQPIDCRMIRHQPVGAPVYDMNPEGEEDYPLSSNTKSRSHNRVQKKNDKIMAKPMKTESMWKRMIRDGFLEALSPKAAYALKKLGFGRRYFQYSKPDPGNKVFFKTNVLLNILDFVQSNSEVELLFDRRLKVDERKEIHNLVQLKLKAKRLESADFDNTEQMELVLKIMEKNCYELQTASTGVYPNRQLCLTKVAPPHVYLIVPEDLKDVLQQKKGEVSSKLKKNLPQEVDKKAVGSPLEPKAKDQKPFKAEADLLAQGNEETNPFLISITKNLNTPEPGSEPQEIGAASYIESSSDKNDPKMGTPENFLEGTEISEKCLEDHELGLTEMDDDEILIPTLEEWLPFKDVIITPMSEVFDRLCDFLQEFRTAKTYTEFKFLGPFTDEELNAIDEFFEEAEKFLIKAGDKYMVPVFKKLAYEVGVDVTGNPVIYKKCVAQQRKLQCRCHPTTEHLGALKKATANRNN